MTARRPEVASGHDQRTRIETTSTDCRHNRPISARFQRCAAFERLDNYTLVELATGLDLPRADWKRSSSSRGSCNWKWNTAPGLRPLIGIVKGIGRLFSTTRPCGLH